jgi:hypothetical protein
MTDATFCFTPVTTRLLELIPNVARDCGLEVVSMAPSTYGGSCDIQVRGNRDNIDTLAANLGFDPDYVTDDGDQLHT